MGGRAGYNTRLQYLYIYTYYNGCIYMLCAKIKLKWKFPSIAAKHLEIQLGGLKRMLPTKQTKGSQLSFM